jgi:hypothetical protein
MYSAPLEIELGGVHVYEPLLGIEPIRTSAGGDDIPCGRDGSLATMATVGSCGADISISEMVTVPFVVGVHLIVVLQLVQK